MKVKLICCVLSVLSVCLLRGDTSCQSGVASAFARAGDVVIDGDLSEWNHSEDVLNWWNPKIADREHATLSFMFDETFFYIGFEMKAHAREIENTKSEKDRYWYGDLLQVRLSTDRTLPYPLPSKMHARARYEKNAKVTCINMWRNTLKNQDCLYVTPGAWFDCTPMLHPEGSEIKSRFSEDRSHLVMEAKIPWKVLGVEDGKCPYKIGEKMPLVCDLKFSEPPYSRTVPTIYQSDPGSFAFLNVQTWGQIAFKEAVPSVAEQYRKIAETARGKDAVDQSEWAKIQFELPKKAKVSVNIFDEKGGVVRELAGGEEHEKGLCTFAWDGRDALGFPCAKGSYRWGAYAHDGLDVKYFGTVGMSGKPPHDTRTGLGGWGADHGPCMASSSDETGRYFIWGRNEQGKGLVKTDYRGNVLWRTTPFVLGGWCDFTCGVAHGKYLYLVHEPMWRRGKITSSLVRIDTKDGDYVLWPSGKGGIPLGSYTQAPPFPARSGVSSEFTFNSAGIAVIGEEIFVSDFVSNVVYVCDLTTGEKKRTMTSVGPRGLCVNQGALYVTSFGEKGGAILKVDPQTGAMQQVVVSGLSFPHGLACDRQGRLYVSDLGESQQIKVFAPSSAGWTCVKTLGKKGGRSPLGQVDFSSYLYPMGLSIDQKGQLIVAEASAPKMFSLIDTHSFETGARYFGGCSYSPSNVPDCDDPLLQYYSLTGPGSFARARIPNGGGSGFPDAAWDFPNATSNEFTSIMNTMTMPLVLRAVNGEKYLVPDGSSAPRAQGAPIYICRIAGDEMIPCAGVFHESDAKGAWLRVWSDANGDGRVQSNECACVRQVAGRNLTKRSLTTVTGSLLMTPNGDLFHSTQDNFVIGFPSAGFKNAVPMWDVAKAYVAIPKLVPDQERLFCTWREGLTGLRRDSHGNFYASIAYSPKYATKELTKYMHQGQGHTSLFTGVFITKYDPQGKMLWKAGRKAVSVLNPGEMLHHWCAAGLIGDEYYATASEWGVFTVYTKDGFYVDRFFDAPGEKGRGLPYSFSGEDFSGQIAYFPKLNQVWAYNCGHTFRVTGFDRGRVKGEWRTQGTVELKKVQPLRVPGAVESELSDVTLVRQEGKVVFTAHVKDASPLENGAKRVDGIFKGGDAVDFQVGPHTKAKMVPDFKSVKREDGFTRILAARMNGKDTLVAFKPWTKGVKAPIEYVTSAGGKAAFEYCGEVPNAKLVFTVDADKKGYSVKMEIPETFFEVDWTKDIFYEAQALLSGDGSRGLQAMKRVYLFTSDSSHTSMVDDVPTEARLYPAEWVKMK